MRKSISRLVLAVVLLTVSLAITQTIYAQTTTATVNTGALNIRTGPGVNYNVITYVYRNTVLTLQARNADASWVKVMTSGGVQGWVNSSYILTAYPLTSLPVDGATGGPVTAVVTAYALNLRSGPGPGYARLLAMPRGTALSLLARNQAASWVKVALATGVQGWVNASYISTTYAIASLTVEGGTPAPQPQPGARTHVVQAGENLFRIGLAYGVDMYDIARQNGITNLTLIYPGQVLVIP